MMRSHTRGQIFSIFILLVLSVVLVLVFFPRLAEGKEIVVDQDGGGDFLSIRDAYSGAEIGDVILVRNGDYLFDLSDVSTAASSVTIRGEDRNHTRLIFPSPTNFYVGSIHFDRINLTSASRDNPAILRHRGGDLTVTNCTSKNMEFHFSPWYWFVQGNDTYHDNTFWGSTFSFSSLPTPSVGSSSYLQYRNVFDRFDLRNNSIDGIPIQFFRSLDGLNITSIQGELVLFNCTNVSISDAELPPGANGFTLYFCENVTVASSHLLDFRQMSFIGSCRNVTFIDSMIGNDHPTSIIQFDDCINITLENCSIFSNITLLSIDGSRFLNNTFLGDEGIHLENTDQSLIIGNSFRSGGISIEDWGRLDPDWGPGHTIENNSIHGDPLIYLTNRTDLEIHSPVGQIFLYHCSNISIAAIHVRDVSIGLYASDSDTIFLTDSRFSKCRIGVIVRTSVDVSIVSCTFEDTFHAITTEESSITITRCKFRNTDVHLGDDRTILVGCTFINSDPFTGLTAIHNSGILTIADSEISGYHRGIYQEASGLTVTNTSIHSNIIGMDLDRYQDMLIDGSLIYSNGGTGVVGKAYELFTIQNSQFLNNGGLGIDLRGANSEIRNVTVEGNLGGGINIPGWQNTVSHSIIRNNRGIGLTGARFIDNCSIEGNTIGLETGWFEMDHSMIINNTEIGVLGTHSTWGQISNTTISGSPIGISMNHSKVNLSQCIISNVDVAFIVHRPRENVSIFRCIILTNPGGEAIRTTLFNAFHVDARECYWGYSSGPYHQTKNSEGQGGTIGDEIFFEPWFRDPEFTDLSPIDDDDSDPSYGTVFFMVILVIFLTGLPLLHKSRSNPAIESGPSPFDSLLPIQWATLPKTLPLAPIRDRVIAAVLDGILICLLLFPALALYIDRMDQVTSNHLLVLATYLLFPGLYFLLFEGIFGQTPGKHVARVRVISLDGPHPSLPKLLFPSFVKGLVFPAYHIIMAIVGIFLFHPETRQRHTQYRNRLIVISEPSHHPRRSEILRCMMNISKTRHALHSARSSIDTLITDSPSIHDLEDMIYFTEKELEQNLFRQPEGEEPTRDELESMRAHRDSIRRALLIQGELSIWIDRMTTFLSEFTPMLHGKANSRNNFIRQVVLIEARRKGTLAQAFLDEIQPVIDQVGKTAM
jgi:uncharacterized RDD family membrane protein YckC